MKLFLLISLVTFSSFSMADHWEKEVSYYHGFGGTGDRMRKETIHVVDSEGKKKRVAERIFVDGSNELRELWTAERPRENITPENQAIWNSLSRHITDDSSQRGSQLNDCTMSEDQRSISCPSGLYVKSSSVNDGLRNAGPKISPESRPGRENPNRVSEE